MLTQELGIALGPRLDDSILERIELIRVSAERLLVALTLSRGAVRTIFVDVKGEIADAAFVATHRFMNTVDAGKAKVDDFNYLWTSPLIPQDPFVYRGTLCAPLKEKIAQTFLTLDQTPEGKAYLENVDSEKFVKMTDKDYDIIRAAADPAK